MHGHRAFLGHFKPHNVRLASSYSGYSFTAVEPATEPIVARILLATQLFLTYLLQALRGAEAVIRMPTLDKLAGIFLVDILALGLVIGSMWATDAWAFIPLDPQPVEAIDQLLFCPWHITPLVGVFDAQDERPTHLPGKQVVI